MSITQSQDSTLLHRIKLKTEKWFMASVLFLKKNIYIFRVLFNVLLANFLFYFFISLFSLDIQTFRNTFKPIHIIIFILICSLTFAFSSEKIYQIGKLKSKGISIIGEFKNITIDLIKKCLKWIETSFITIFFAIVLVLVFLYFEDKIVDKSFSFLRIIIDNKFGDILLWVLFWGAIITIYYYIVKITTNNTLFDGRTFFLSLVLCCLFVYCTKKYPWEMVDPDLVNIEMVDSPKVNPIAGHEWAFVFLFLQYAICFLILPFILYIRVALKKAIFIQSSKSSQTGKYLTDQPITSKDKDELYFGSHVLALKKRIDEIPVDETPVLKSHSIALTGGWGTGKTSFLYLLQEELIEQGQYEIIWFNPLKSSKSGNIQNDFFNALENKLSKYKTGFGRRIKYYKELIGAIDNKYISFLIKLGNIQLEEEKKRINDIIKMIPKKIIIIIDDVDRLKGKEIIQVFKLIGFNAEFNNVVFLLPLDKINVIKALDCEANYPDKFFEMEFPLPDNYRYFTSEFIKNKLHNILSEIPMDFLNDEKVSNYTAYCINNMRDASRFLNSFIERARMIYDKLDLHSYYLLALIQYKDPLLYEKIRTEDQELLVKMPPDKPEKQYWVLKDAGCSKLDEIIKQMLQDLFPLESQPDEKPKLSLENSIYQLDFFPYYFNEFSTKVITDAMMLKLLLLEPNTLREKLDQYSENEITKQYIAKSLKRIGEVDSMKSIIENKESERIITNYYKSCNQIGVGNGLKYNNEDIVPVKIGKGRFAYINKNGKDAFRITCDRAYHFSEGLARVKYNGKYGFIDKNGNDGFNTKKDVLDVSYKYRFALGFHNNCAPVIKGLKKGSINKQGVFAGRFSYLCLFAIGLVDWKVDEKGELKGRFKQSVLSMIISVLGAVAAFMSFIITYYIR